MSDEPQREHPGARLRRLMSDHCVGLPGAFNGMVARLVADAGFEGAYVSGAAVTASAGVPDVGMLTLGEFTSVVWQVTRSSGLPVIADADTGFGESEMVTRTVVEYDRAGAAGLHLEDQVFPKRCGHLEGKTLVPVDHFQEKIAAAAEASRLRSGGDFIVCARTDAAGVAGAGGLDGAVERARAYLDAGADMLFPEGLRSLDDFRAFAEAARAHRPGCFLLANMTEFGKTPIIPLSDFERAGYSCVIWPVSSLRSAMGEVVRLLESIRRDGTVEASLDGMLDRAGLYRSLGYTPGEEWRFPAPSGS